MARIARADVNYPFTVHYLPPNSPDAMHIENARVERYSLCMARIARVVAPRFDERAIYPKYLYRKAQIPPLYCVLGIATADQCFTGGSRYKKLFQKELDNPKLCAIFLLLAENSTARRQDQDATRSRLCKAGKA
jgi:hypothetical protein